MDRIDYTADYNVQTDEELFDVKSSEDYDDYVVYSYEEDYTGNAILLNKTTDTPNKKTVLKAKIEKSYSDVRQVEAINAVWDNSKNFKTILNTNPDMFKTLPSIFLESRYGYSFDEDFRAEWGQAYLSSHNGITAGFIDNLESSYDNGIKLSSKFGKLNFSGGVYETIHSQSGGLVISTDEIKIKSGSFIVGGGIYSTGFSNENYINTAGVFTKYSKDRFSLGIQFAQDYGNNGKSAYLYPSFKINSSLTLTGCLACYLDGQYAREEIGLVYSPLKNRNDLSLSLKFAFYNGEGIVNKQRIKLMSEFRI